MNQELYPDWPILIVDDNKDFLNSIDFTLKTEGITNVELCSDSREVLGLLKQKKYSLVLLDLKMPYISGRELLPQIKNIYPSIPIIILTGHADIPKAIECIKTGAFDLWEKTADTPQLLEKIKKGLEQLPKDSEQLICKDDLEPGDVEFIRKIDIPALAYRLVLSRDIQPEFLANPNRNEMKKALQPPPPAGKEAKDLVKILRSLKDDFSGQEPNSLWYSWITTTRDEKIRELKKMIGGNE
ncbi:MAG: response regulator [Candidatus Aminicenantes bacterium]|nr:response regulator [Candidatus Aminicenantes bacterium]